MDLAPVTGHVRRHLGTKFAVAALALTALPVVIVGAIGFSLGSRGIQTHTDLHLQSVAALKGDQIEGWLADQREMVSSRLYPSGSTSLVQDLLVEGPDPAPDAARVGMDEALHPLLDDDYALVGVSVMDGGGRIRYASRADLPDVADLTGDQLRGDGDGLGLGLVSPESDGGQALLVLVERARGGREGTVAAYLSLSPVQELLRPDPGLGEHGRSYLVGGDGMVVTTGGVLRAAPAGALEAVVGAGERLERFTGFEGTEVVGRSERLDGLPWTTATTIPVRYAFADVARMRWLMGLAVVAVGGAGALAGWRFSGGITRPLRRLVAGVQALGGGDLDVRLTMRERDEVGELAASFNDMAEALSEAYQAVTRERTTLREIQASMTDGMVVVDGTGRVVYFNGAAQRFTGLDSHDAIGRPLHELLTPEDYESADAFRSLGGLVAGAHDGPRTLELVRVRPVRRDLVVTAFPIGNGPDEELTGFIIRDATAERALERRRDAFVSIASHELRTPMTTIIGLAEILLDRAEPGDGRRSWLERVLRESRRLSNIVDNMLNASRIQAAKLTAKREPVPLEEVVREAAADIQGSTDLHELVTDIPEGLPPAQADRDMVAQVLTNLLTNAVKYSPEGGRIRLAVVHDSERQRLVVSVSDQGIGIAPADRENLFTTFHRIERPETAGVRGTGLGLYIVRELTGLMGGDVWLHSEPGRGTVFSFSLPTGVPEDAPDGPIAGPGRAEATHGRS